MNVRETNPTVIEGLMASQQEIRAHLLARKGRARGIGMQFLFATCNAFDRLQITQSTVNSQQSTHGLEWKKDIYALCRRENEM